MCQEYPLVGLRAMFEAHNDGNTRPFRFLYMSGTASERDQNKTPSWMPQYCLMRVSTRFHATGVDSSEDGPPKLTVLGNLLGRD